MTGTYENLDQRLTQASIAIANARQNPRILDALSTYGYDETVLQQGQDLLDTARALTDAQRKEYGDQFAATAALQEALAAADRLYTTHRTLAKLAFKAAPGRRTALALDERKKQSFSGWLTQAKRFYANLLADADAIAALARFQITQEKLTQGQALVEEVERLDQKQEDEKAEAQQATRERDAALDALDDWLAEFHVVARIALTQTPQLLESLQPGAIT